MVTLMIIISILRSVFDDISKYGSYDELKVVIQSSIGNDVGHSGPGSF